MDRGPHFPSLCAERWRGQGRRIIIKLMTLYANNGPNIATSNGFVHTAHRSTLGSAATGLSALELDCSFHIMMYYQP